MANGAKGEVGFDAGGKSYTLIYDVNALCLLEERFDVPAEKLGERIGDAPRLGDLRTIFRIGLCRYHPEMLDEREGDLAAGDLITEVGPARAAEIIGEAFTKGYPTEVAGKGNGRPQKQAGKRGTS